MQDDTDAAALAINGLLQRMTEGELDGLMASISDRLGDALLDWDFEIEPSSYLRYEVDTSELKLEDFSFVEQGEEFAFTIVRLEAEETAIQVDVVITATAVADFSLYAWDSIDREEIGLGTTSASTEETFPASILITLLGPLAGPLEELEIEDVEVVEALGSVNVGEIEMDYGEDDRDDYDQLQLALTAAAI